MKFGFFIILLSLSAAASAAQAPVVKMDQQQLIIMYASTNSAWRLNEACNFLNPGNKLTFKLKLNEFNNSVADFIKNYPDQESLHGLMASSNRLADRKSKICEDKDKKFVLYNYDFVSGLKYQKGKIR